MGFLAHAVGPLNLGQWLGLIAASIVVSSVLRTLAANRAGAPADTSVGARCLGCGWKGKVSKYHRTCPKCGNSITRLSHKEE